MEITVFKNDEFSKLRTVSIDGEPWFIAKDVCTSLGLARHQDSTRYLDSDEKRGCLVNTPYGDQELLAISEAGFYKLAIKSRSPNAKRFQRWVTHEVLPSIRRQGGYMATREGEAPEELMARALLVAREALDRKDRELAEMRPKALFADAVAASDGTCLVGELAKMLRQSGVEVGQNRLFEWLRRDGYLGSVGQNRNVPTQRAMERGLFRIKETAVTHSDGHVTLSRTPKVTGNGQRHFMERYGARVLAE